MKRPTRLPNLGETFSRFTPAEICDGLIAVIFCSVVALMALGVI